jgi:hypothetical protein
MPREQYGSVRAGVFVVASGVVIILFILALGERSHLFTREYSLTAAFEKLAKKVTLVELDPDVAAVWKTILRGFESVYYSFAPFFARKIDPSATLRRLTRIFVADPFVNMIILVLFVSSKRFRLSLSAKNETSFCKGMAGTIIGGIGGHLFGWSWLLWNVSLALTLFVNPLWWITAAYSWLGMGAGLFLVLANPVTKRLQNI